MAEGYPVLSPNSALRRKPCARKGGENGGSRGRCVRIAVRDRGARWGTRAAGGCVVSSRIAVMWRERPPVGPRAGPRDGAAARATRISGLRLGQGGPLVGSGRVVWCEAGVQGREAGAGRGISSAGWPEIGAAWPPVPGDAGNLPAGVPAAQPCGQRAARRMTVVCWGARARGRRRMRHQQRRLARGREPHGPPASGDASNSPAGRGRRPGARPCGQGVAGRITAAG